MTIDHTIQIAASPSLVWEVTKVVENWPEWTPTVTSVTRVGDDPIAVGSRVRIKQPAQPETEWTVTSFDPPKRFAWETRRTGIYMKAIHEIAGDGDGTFNTLRLEASGFLAVLLWPVLRVAVRKALKQENRGLKAYCEAQV